MCRKQAVTIRVPRWVWAVVPWTLGRCVLSHMSVSGTAQTYSAKHGDSLATALVVMQNLRWLGERKMSSSQKSRSRSMYKCVRKLSWPWDTDVFLTSFCIGPCCVLGIQPLTLDECLFRSSHAMERERLLQLTSTMHGILFLVYLNTHLLNIK